MQPDFASAASPAWAAARSTSSSTCAQIGIERLQPLEQRRLLGEPAGRPLVEVVVAVDEPWRGEHAAAVDADVAVLGLGGAGADLVDEAVADDDVPVRVLGALRVDGGDRAVLDDEPAHRAWAAARTASRIFS